MTASLARSPRSAALASLVLPAARATALPATAGTVEVDWVQPEHYSDAGRSIVDRERTLQTLTGHFERLGRRLPDGQTLKLEVLDIDLAGELQPWGWHELRVLRGRADWPHLTLRYTLLEGDATLQAGQARLSDMNYLMALRGHAPGAGDLAYEKRMLSRWFDETFGGSDRP
jgi:hypothetical protein